ncbi:MAG: hypothetical protein IKO62_00555 [Bacteroidales bacterium]|nr:hypothetical protein [Bacteroidales bacterium]
MKIILKNLILLLLCCMIAGYAMAQDNLNRVDKNGKKQGPWKKYDKGVLVYEGQFVNDVPQGTFKYYYPNGKLKSVSEFVTGVSKVNVINYHENGNVASKGTFINQQKDGLWQYFSDKNVLLSEENYKLGKKNGRFVTYSVDGYKLKEEQYADNQLNGECKSYFEKEEIFMVSHYINGKLNGEMVTYYPGAIISQKGVYYNGLRTGEWETYDAKGQIRLSEEFDKEGRLLKKYMYLYVNGQPQKIKQNLIAYFQKKGENKTTAILRNGNKIETTESLSTIVQWLDKLEYVPVTPKLYAEMSCVRGYKNIDEKTIKVVLKPALDYEVIAQDEDADLIRSLFATGEPSEN